MGRSITQLSDSFFVLLCSAAVLCVLLSSITVDERRQEVRAAEAKRMLALAQAEAEAQKATDAAAQAPKDGEGDIGAALYTEEAALDRGESVSALTTSSLQAQKPP